MIGKNSELIETKWVRVARLRGFEPPTSGALDHRAASHQLQVDLTNSTLHV